SASFLGFDFAAASAHIDKDNFVADSFHLHKGVVGERAHTVLLPGFRQVYMANKRGLTSGHDRVRSVVSELQDRRNRRRTVMSPSRLAPITIAVAFALTACPAAAQNPPAPPTPNRNGPNAAATPIWGPGRTVAFATR